MSPSLSATESIQELIATVLRTCDPELLLSRVPSFRAQHHKKGDVLLPQAKTWDKVFFVQHGILRTHVIDNKGVDFNNSFYTEDTLLLPLTKELECSPSLFNVSAVESSVIWCVPIAEFRDDLNAQALWEPLRVELLCRLVNHKLQREFDLLTLDGRARYQKFCKYRPELANRLPLIHIASYLGLTNVSLSRYRRDIK